MSGDSGDSGEAEDVTDMAEISVGADDDQWLGLAATQDDRAVGGAVGNNEALIAAGSSDDVYALVQHPLGLHGPQ